MPAPKFCEPQITTKYHDNCLEVKPVISAAKKNVKSVCENGKGMRKPKNYAGKETYDYYDGENMRMMLIPSKDTNYYPVTITKDELKRLQQQAIVLTDKQKLKLLEDAKKEKNRLEDESIARKRFLQQFSTKGGPGMPPRLSALEREARDKANYLLKRAWELKKEDEDEVKRLNSLILQTKCQAIRDAQLAERRLLQEEMKKEEKRLEEMMEDERSKAFMQEKKKREEERALKERYVSELNQQMEEIEAQRLLDAEKMVEERKKTNEAMYQIMMEDLNKIQEQEEIKKKMREELNLANEELRKAKELEKEEERIGDLKIQEYLRLRNEREAKLELEIQEEKKKREMETARLRALQEAAFDLQALQDEMAAVRRQEEYEREWRRKERDQQRKKQKMEEDCRLGREQQIRDIHRFQASELAREKREFERNLVVQLEQQEKERLLEIRKKHEAEVYREEILKQINQKERERIEERQEKFAEGLSLKAEEAKRQSEIKAVIEKKIENLRQNRVPESYIKEIQRRFHVQ